jgi:hypothetical protein
MANLEDLQVQLQDYALSHRRDGLAAYSVSGVYDLYPQNTQTAAIAVASKWPDDWPNSSNAGVYAIFDEHFELIYVGKSSMNSFIAARLGTYFGYTSAPERLCRLKGEWRIEPRYLITVGVPDDATWEAPALEEFLIQKLNPTLNRNGRTL